MTLSLRRVLPSEGSWQRKKPIINTIIRPILDTVSVPGSPNLVSQSKQDLAQKVLLYADRIKWDENGVAWFPARSKLRLAGVEVCLQGWQLGGHHTKRGRKKCMMCIYY